MWGQEMVGAGGVRGVWGALGLDGPTRSQHRKPPAELTRCLLPAAVVDWIFFKGLLTDAERGI